MGNRLFVALVLILSIAFGQEKVDMDVVKMIRDQGMTDKSKVMDIAWHMTDVNGPRLTASPGSKKANKWAEDKMKEWGLENVHQEAWGAFGKSWINNRYSIEMMSPYYDRLIAAPKAWTKGTNGEITGTPMIIDINEEADLAKYKGKLAGKIIMTKTDVEIPLATEADAVRMTDEQLLELTKDVEQGGNRRNFTPEQIAAFRARRALANKISEFFTEENVGAVLSISRDGRHGTVFTTNGANYRSGSPNAVAEFEVLREHYLKLQRLVLGGINPVVKLSMDNTINEADSIAYNVIGEIPGKGDLKDEIVMVGAHYDSWHSATGATDNAAGSAVMMEVVRILQAIKMNDADDRRTVRIALWTGEEQGLHGSRNYVKQHFADPADMKPLPEHSKISAYYNLDNGSGKIRGVWMQGNEAVAPIFQEYLKPFHKDGAQTLTKRNTGGTDHLAFDGVGIPGFQFIQDRLEYNSRTHHTNMDVYDRFQADDLKQAATIIATFVYHTAVREEKLPREAMPEPRASLF
ncbi:MAG: M20/M25/M40 family metallo-hydrolase [Calditrichaeota bacterium]|nr:M20/M25/M40 family metallo-hydrolase [Calditrichota bacterium]